MMLATLNRKWLLKHVKDMALKLLVQNSTRHRGHYINYQFLSMKDFQNKTRHSV